MATVEELVKKIDDLSAARVSTEVFNGAIGELKSAIELRNAEVKTETEKIYGTVEEVKKKLAEEFAQKLADAAKEFKAFSIVQNGSKIEIPDVKTYGECFGDFMFKIRNNPDELKTLSENTGSLGGYLVPPAWSNIILKRSIEAALVRGFGPSTIQLPSPEFNIPMIVSTSNASNFYGGVMTYWGAEATNLANSKTTPKFGKLSLSAKKLFGYTEAYEDLNKDSFKALGPLLQQVFGDALGFEEDIAFFHGDGVGKPLGVTSAPCRATVSRQTASQIHTIDIVGMMARFNGRLDRAVFTANQSTIPYIYTLQDASGAYIWHPGNNGNIAGASPGSIYGVPLVISEKMKALGTEGDIGLGDWSQYIIGDMPGLRVEESTEYKFGEDIRCWKMIKRLDGKPWLPTAVTPRYGGSTLSPFVFLT
jgi:HK97 family phage major capsid protein